jgi:hypothetical protein
MSEMSDKQVLEITEKSARDQKEVWAEFHTILELLPLNADGKELFKVLFTEMWHWLFTAIDVKHPAPSRVLMEVLASLRSDLGGGAGGSKPQKYDA